MIFFNYWKAQKNNINIISKQRTTFRQVFIFLKCSTFKNLSENVFHTPLQSENFQNFLMCWNNKKKIQSSFLPKLRILTEFFFQFKTIRKKIFTNFFFISKQFGKDISSPIIYSFHE